MKQQFLHRVLWLLIPLLTLFSIHVWGATESITYSNAVYSGSGNSGIHTWTMTSCTVVQAKGTGTAVNSSYPNRWYQNNLITFTPKSGYTISKIELNGSSGSYNGQTMTVTSGGGSLAVSSNKTTWTGTATSAVTIRLGTQFRFGSVTITYSASASYSVVWTINPAAGGSLSATSGTSTTVTPNSAYTYGDPAYTVTTGSATVSQSTNTFTATPSANCTIRINMVEKPKYTITYHVGSGTCATSSWTQTTAGQSTTLPTATPGCDGWSFAGWCTSSAGDEDDNTTSPGTILTGEYTPTSNVDLYAVYTKTEGGGGNGFTLSLITDKSGSDVEYYIAPRSGSNTYLSSTTNAAEAETFYIEDDDLYYYNGETKTYVNSNENNTSLSFVTSNPVGWTITETSNKWTFQSKGTGTRHLAYNYNGGSPRFSSYAGSNTYPYQFTKHPVGTTYYMTDYECAPTPTITVSTTSIAFGDKKVGSSYTSSFTVSGSDLTADIGLSVGGANPTLFSIDKTTLTQSAGSVASTTITVTWTPSAAYNGATITISSTGATSKTVALSGTGKWEVTWMRNGDEYETTLVASGQRPIFPESAPTSCDTGEGASTTFYGWATEGWTGKIDNLTGKTVYVSNGEMPTVSANGTIYYAVFAQATTTSTSKDYTFEITTADFPGSGYAANDGDHNSTATASDASTQTVTWTSSNVCEQSGSIQFKKSSGCLYNGTSYGTIKSVTITSGSNLSHFENSSAQPTGSGTPKNYFQVKAGGSTGTCSKITVVYTASSSTTTYSNYLTTCCNTPTLAFAASPYAVIRQDIQGASTTTWAEVDVTFTSNNTTGTISATTYTSGKTVYSLSTWQSRATTGGSLCATDHAYFEVLTQPSGETPGTGKLHVKTTSGQTGQGTYRIALTQESTDESHGNFCETTVYGFVDVTLRDKFVDVVNGNGTVNKDGHGAQVATPLLSELGTQVENACHSEGRKLKGWIKETDLTSNYGGSTTRVQTLDGKCQTCDDSSDITNKIVAPGTNTTMSGVTWYAVWAYEK